MIRTMTEVDPLTTGVALRAAREALAHEAGKDPAACGDDAELALQRHTEALLVFFDARAIARATLPGTPYPEGMLAFAEHADAQAIKCLRALVAPGPAAAEQWERDATSRRGEFACLSSDDPAWDGWCPEEWIKRFAFTVAMVLWRGEVRASIEVKREKTPRQPAALSLVFMKDYDRVYLNTRNKVRVRATEEDRATAEVLSPEGETLARTPVLYADNVVHMERGFAVFRSYLGHRALRRVPTAVWERHCAGERDYQDLHFHGIEGWREWLGSRKKDQDAEALALLRAGQAFQRTWGDTGRPDREVGGLWTYDLDSRTAPGKPASLVVRAGACFRPYFAKDVLRHGENRLVMPIPPMPPTVGSPNAWAAQASLQLAIVRSLVEHRDQVLEHGGAVLDLETLAATCGVRELARVLDRWMRDGDDGRAMLEEVERGRYHLADNDVFGPARRAIDATARLTARRRRAAKARNRQAKRG